MALGLTRAGYKGAFAAWAGFTLPSALMMVLLALGMSHQGGGIPAGLLHGLKVVTVAVIAQAAWGMFRQLCPDWPRMAVMAVSAGVLLGLPSAWTQIAVLVAAGVVGALWLTPSGGGTDDVLPMPVSRRAALGWLSLFGVLLLGLPLAAGVVPSQPLAVVEAFYRAGSLVFGGGHVVLPLLQAAVVPAGWVDNNVFLAGYGAVQAVPGPLFTFAAFLGASLSGTPTGWVGGVTALVAIFLPSFLLLAGMGPFWASWRTVRPVRAALAGVNAAVVGLLVAALYQPAWTNAVHSLPDVALVVLALLALMRWKLPPWLVVAGAGLVGWLLA
jgi:chromate transporter